MGEYRTTMSAMVGLDEEVRCRPDSVEILATSRVASR